MFDCKRYVVLVILFWHWHYYKLSHSYAVTAFNGIDFQYLLDDVSLCIKRNSSSKEFKSEVSDSGKKSKKKKAVEKKKMFSLFYGYYAVEVINALSNDQILKLFLLADCLAEEEALRDIVVNLATNSSEFSSPEHHRYLRHTSNTSNLYLSTTFLNGFLQLLLPDVHRSILTAANHGIRKAHWNSDDRQEDLSTEYPDIDELGIRTIQLHTIEISGMEDYQEKLKKKVIERENSGVVSFGGPKPTPPPPPKLQELLQDPDSEEFAAQYLKQHYSSSSRREAQMTPADVEDEGVVERGPEDGDWEESEGEGDGSTYTLFFLLSERSDFVGGEVWVSNMDDEDINGNEIVVDPDTIVVKAPHGSLVTKFTPEKGSLVLTHSGRGRPHGHGPLVVGRRSMLVVELWPFKDASPGTKRPALSEAASFSPSHDFRLEL
eukprot:gene27803-36631_t